MDGWMDAPLTDTTCDLLVSARVFCFLPLLCLILSHWILPCLSPVSPFYLSPPSPLLAGCLGGDKFGGEQAEGGQTRSLCVHIVEQETGWGGGSVAGR